MGSRLALRANNETLAGSGHALVGRQRNPVIQYLIDVAAVLAFFLLMTACGFVVVGSVFVLLFVATG